jgi:hypothetical protein
MPDIEIKHETEHVLRMSLAFGVQLFCENVGARWALVLPKFGLTVFQVNFQQIMMI